MHMSDKLMGISYGHADLIAVFIVSLRLLVNVLINLPTPTPDTKPFPFSNHKECIK